jgi:hypothetical protein
MNENSKLAAVYSSMIVGGLFLFGSLALGIGYFYLEFVFSYLVSNYGENVAVKITGIIVTALGLWLILYMNFKEGLENGRITN